MIEREIEIRMSDGTAESVLYSLDGGRRWPGVIHLTDIGGIRQAHRDMARRLAVEGYTVLMPNVYYRTRRVPLFDFPPNFGGDEKTTQRLAELTGPLTAEAMERDALSYTEYLALSDSAGPGPMGVVGYCATGAFAMRIAAAHPEKIAAAASFHGGRLFTDDPASPHLLLPRIKAALYCGHAIQDRSMTAEAIEKFNRALESWGGQYESEIYEGARHGWTVPDNPAYNQTQAERAFQKLTDLLAKTLK